MSNCITEEKLLDLVVGELPEAEADAVLAHTKECDTCRQVQADFKFSVSFFQNRLGDIPDMPKQLSQHHFKEIITTARELEAELPNIWNKPTVTASEPVQTEYWGRTVAWSVAALFAIALGIALFVKRPWDAEPPRIVEVDPAKPQGTDPKPEPLKIIPPTVTPKPKPVNEQVVEIPKPQPVKPETTPTPVPEPKPEPVEVVVRPVPEPKPEIVVQKPKDPVPVPPRPVVVPEPPQPDPVVEKPVVAITVYSMTRNRLPRHLKSTPGRPDDSGLQFTSTGYVRKVSSMEAKKYPATAKTNLTDERDLFELEYKTDEYSANRLIDVNEQILMAGGEGARNMRFKPRSGTLEVIGNRQELMAIHRTQEFLCDASKSAINLSLQESETPTQVVSGHRAGILYLYHGRPVDAKQLISSVPNTIMKQIKVAKVESAVKQRVAQKEEAQAKLDEAGSNGNAYGKEKERNVEAIGKDRNKDKNKNRPKAFSLKPSGRIPGKKNNKKTNKKNQANRVVSNGGGVIDWQTRSDTLEQTPVKVELSDEDFGGVSQTTIDTLKAKKISKKRFTNWTFNRVMNSLCQRASVRFIDLSDQSDTKLSLKLETVSTYDAIEDLCRGIDVLVTYSAEGVIVSPQPAKGTMQTAIFKLGPKYISLREILRQTNNPKNVLEQHGVIFPAGSGVSVTRNQQELIIHNTDDQLQKAVQSLDLGRWD